MADKRKVLSGVRIGNEVYTDADELEKAATPEQLSRLQESGAISGFTIEEAAEPEEAGEEATPKATKKTRKSRK